MEEGSTAVEDSMEVLADSMAELAWVAMDIEDESGWQAGLTVGSNG